jgi:hypothetical protein
MRHLIFSKEMYWLAQILEMHEFDGERANRDASAGKRDARGAPFA